ncbi:hypothetical protein RXV86_03695 [Alisedimentitalea sp. MJ-SS2]|nr:hypothetical protein [Alisedimentitalea sp. MJ-SS2]
MGYLRQALLIALMLVTSVANAETRTKLYSKGSWSLYKVDGFVVREKRGISKHNNACVAEVKAAKGLLRIAASRSGWIVVQVSSQNWKFRARKSSFQLKSGGATSVLSGSTYSGSMIQHIGGHTGNMITQLFLIKLLGSGTINIIDNKRRTIAKFPLSGYVAVMERTLSCAGMKMP